MPTLIRRIAIALLLCAITALGFWLFKRPSGEKNRIDFFHVWSGLRTAHADDALDRFLAANPDIEIHRHAVNPSWAKPYILDAARKGYLTDVVMINAAWAKEIDPDNTLLDLTPFLEAEDIELQKMIPPAEVVEGMINNRSHLIPFSAQSVSSLLFINEKLTAQAGISDDALNIKTWDQFIDLSKILVEKLNPPGELETIAWNPLLDRGIPTIALLAKSLGLETQTADGRFALLDTAEMYPAWVAVDRYITEVYGSRGGAHALLRWRNRYGGFSTNSAFLPFAHSRCAFSISGLWAFGIHARITPNLAQSVRPVPGLHKPIPLFRSHSWQIGISKTSTNPEAAWKLLRFLTLEEDGNRNLNIAFGLIPAISAYQNPEPYLKLYGPRWKQLLPYIEHSPASVADFNADYIEPIALSFLTLRASGLSLEQTITKLQSEMQSYLEADGIEPPRSK